jgi:hypothetical protein
MNAARLIFHLYPEIPATTLDEAREGDGRALLIFGFLFPCRGCFSPLCPDDSRCALRVRIAAALVSLNGHMKIRR